MIESKKGMRDTMKHKVMTKKKQRANDTDSVGRRDLKKRIKKDEKDGSYTEKKLKKQAKQKMPQSNKKLSCKSSSLKYTFKTGCALEPVLGGDISIKH